MVWHGFHMRPKQTVLLCLLKQLSSRYWLVLRYVIILSLTVTSVMKDGTLLP